MPDIEKMTQATHDWMSSSGCDPHCHACGCKLNVGDEWGFHRFVDDEIVTEDGMRISGISGSACRRCIVEDRPLPPEERAILEDKLRAIRAPQPKKEPKKEPAASFGQGLSAVDMKTTPGCFIMDDGTIL
jgi:hypothetical protein